jgi:hypothetical protein
MNVSDVTSLAMQLCSQLSPTEKADFLHRLQATSQLPPPSSRNIAASSPPVYDPFALVTPLMTQQTPWDMPTASDPTRDLISWQTPLNPAPDLLSSHTAVNNPFDGSASLATASYHHYAVHPSPSIPPMISVVVPPAPTVEASSISPSLDHSSAAETLIKQFTAHLTQTHKQNQLDRQQDQAPRRGALR